MADLDLARTRPECDEGSVGGAPGGVFSVVRTTTFRPRTLVAKSIMSSTEVTHRFVSPRLGARSHSLSASASILAMVESSAAWNICFSAPILEVEKGSLEAITRGKNDLLGILSFMSGIGIMVPLFNIFSRKNFPGSTHRGGGGGALAVGLERIVSHIGLVSVALERLDGGVAAGAVSLEGVLRDIAVEAVGGKGVIGAVSGLAVVGESGAHHIGVGSVAGEPINGAVSVFAVARKPLVAGVGIVGIRGKSLFPAVGGVGIGSESHIGDIDVRAIVRELSLPAGGARAVSVEALVNHVAVRGIIGKSILVSHRVAAVSAERVDRDVLVIRVILERVDPPGPRRFADEQNPGSCVDSDSPPSAAIFEYPAYCAAFNGDALLRRNHGFAKSFEICFFQ
nr:hypothetical protein [Ipomoea batatas]